MYAIWSREVRIGKNGAWGYSLRYHALLKTEDTVFPKREQPRSANDVVLFTFFIYGIALKATFVFSFK